MNGSAVRRNTYIDIPLEIGLPHFIQDDKMQDDGPLYGNFKLSLQSVVCHRGVSVDSGHYISLVRGTAANAQKNNDSSESEAAWQVHKPEDRWMRFDDLAEERISYVDIENALREESPYLLFYQVQPIDDVPSNPVPSEDPPSYSEFDIKHSTFSNPSMDSNRRSLSSNGDAGDTERPSLDGAISEDPPGRSSMGSDCRVSIALTDGSGGIIRPDQAPVATTTPNSENAGSSWRMSRRGSMFGKSGSKSRPSSQSGENRLSATFSRLALRLNKDKLWVPNGNGGGNGKVNGNGNANGTGNTTVEASEEAFATLLDPDSQPKANGGADKAKSKKATKEKKTAKASPEQDDPGTKTKDHVKVPDRECTIM